MPPQRKNSEPWPDGFCREAQAGFTIERPRTALAAALTAGLLPDPDRLLEGGEIFKPGSRTHAGKIVVGGRACFLKRFNCRGWWYVVRHLLKRPRANRTWEIHCEMYRRGLPVPEPFACLVERRFGLLQRSYILSDFAAGFEPLYKIWPVLREEEKLEALRGSGDLLGRMHRERIAHGDCKWSNLLVRRAGGGLEFMLVDLDASRLLSRPSSQRARRDVDRFLRDLRKAEGSDAQAGIFLGSWSARLHAPAACPETTGKRPGLPAVLP